MRIDSSNRLMSLRTFVVWGATITILTVIGFSVLQWLDIPTGRLVDWIVGVLSIWWLLVIVTLPWDIYFQTREVLADAEKSQESGMQVPSKPIEYVKTWSTRSLAIAVALHVVSSGVLYALAHTGISPVGYISAGAALLLTMLRPIMRGYEYLVMRLITIKQGLHYPREDVQKLRQDMNQLARKVESMETHQNARMAQHASYAEDTRGFVMRLQKEFQESQTANEQAHVQLSKDTQHAVAQVAETGEFLNHVSEILRFVRSAFSKSAV